MKCGIDNIFSQIRKTIKHYSKGVIFEEEIMADYNAFAHKRQRAATGTLQPQELQKVLKRKAIEECETTRPRNKSQKAVLKNLASSLDSPKNAI